MPDLPKIVAVVGPTASGKTDVALRLAKRFSGEIILADSRQVYRGMDIGTNKLVAETRRTIRGTTQNFIVDGVPYWGIDLVEPNETFTVQDWKKFAVATIHAVIDRDHLPIIEGGTGLYVTSLLDNFDIPEVPPDPTFRESIELKIKNEGLEKIAQEVLENDPDAAAFLDIKNPRRVIRALEVIRATQLPFSQQRRRNPKLFDDLRLGIGRPLEEIDRRITKRAREQFDAGLADEVQRLVEKYGWDIPPMSGIGYSEWRNCLMDRADCDTVLKKNIQRNQRLARAQLKWFRHDPSIRWIRDADEAEELTKRFLEKNRGQVL